MSNYFPHDANSMNDPKCMLLINQLGMEGYGIFWALIEILRTQNEYKLPIEIIPALAIRFNISQVKVETVIRNYGLFICDDCGFFYSSSLINRMDQMESVRKKKILGGIKSGEARRAKALMLKNEQCSNSVQTQVEQSLNTNRTQVNYLKKDINTNIEYKNKKEEKNMGASNDATSSRMKSFYLDVYSFNNLYDDSMLHKFYDYWSELDSKGKKMKFELNKTWETEKRLRTWASKAKEFSSSKNIVGTTGAVPVSKMQQMITTIEDSVNQVGYE